MCYSVVLSCIILTSILTLISTTLVVNEFADPTNPDIFNHVVVNKNTGIIYMAAVNRIYKMTPNLTLESSVKTGPQMDNPICYPRDPHDCPTQKPLPNFNKVLLIDYGETQKLIACSTLYHGFCEKRDLQNISIKYQVYEPVVANDKTSSTVAFIAPGPAPIQGGPQSTVMYVGATWTTVGLPAYRDLVPAFSSRKLSDFKFVYRSWSASSKQDIESQLRDRFLVKYVYGFSSDNFSYMVTKQKNNTEPAADYISKMIRVCQNDKRYYSYAEVPLNCTYQGTTYKIVHAATVDKAGKELANSLGLAALSETVLYAVFSKSQSQLQDSVMCIFPLTQIRRIFTENIQQCFNGEGHTGPEHIVKQTSCVKTKYSITKEYCGEYEINRPIDGTIAIHAEAVVKFAPVTKATAIAVTTTHDYTVAFVGLLNGHLKKVSIQSKTLAEEYDDIAIEEGSPISKDLTFDLEKNHLYVMTERKLSMLKVQECTRYTTCKDCIGARDPYCGWCSLENRCSIRNECTERDTVLRWLPYNGAHCPAVIGVTPPRAEIESGKRTLLIITTHNLPPLSSQYNCAFSGYGMTLITTAIRQDNVVRCSTPETTNLPQIPKGSDHIVMSLSVRVNTQDFVSTNLTFFSCHTHKDCTNCTQSNFPCTWCVQNHMCSQYSDNCVGDALVTGQTNSGKSGNPGPANCPRIEATSTKTHVPSGTKKTVTVKAVKLKPFQSNLKCFFNMGSGRQVSAVVAKNGDIECSVMEFSYNESQPSRNVAFQITWGINNHTLDNPSNIQVIMYKCSAMADSCGACLTMESQYKCGWCDNRCAIEAQCSRIWLPSASTCPDPRIFQITPRLGPISGGTNLTILGENLGKTYEDIDGGISIAGVPCFPYRESYVTAKKVVCRTGAARKPVKTHVNMTINGLYVTLSVDKFHYVVPRITDINPKLGPQAGGTSLTISGQHMNAGNKRVATVDDKECTITSFNENEVICTTPVAKEKLSGFVRLSFDDALPLQFRGDLFRYVPNPTVNIIVQNKRKSIVSGGLSVDVSGTNFHAIQKPVLILWVGNQSFVGSCSHNDIQGRQLNCITPNLTNAPEISNISSPQRIAYGFEMDNVESVRNLSQSEEYYRFFIIYPDPLFYAFKDGVWVHRKETSYIIINGENMLPGVDISDVKVYVGRGECHVTSMAPSQLTCIPPLYQLVLLSGKEYPKVYIRVGNLAFEVGYFKYMYVYTEVLNNTVPHGVPHVSAGCHFGPSRACIVIMWATLVGACVFVAV